MPRPDTVTPEDINRWRREIRQTLHNTNDWALRAVLEKCLDDSVFADRIAYSGAWLGERLVELGCLPELKHKICFAHGQRVFRNADPWGLAQAALDAYKEGLWEEPGLELAERVISETLPELLPERQEAPCGK